MYACHISLQVGEERRSEFAAALAGEIVPFIRNQKGLEEATTYFFADHATAANTLLVCIWDTRAHAESFDHNYYRQVAKMLSRFSSEPPVMRRFDVPFASRALALTP